MGYFRFFGVCYGWELVDSEGCLGGSEFLVVRVVKGMDLQPYPKKSKQPKEEIEFPN